MRHRPAGRLVAPLVEGALCRILPGRSVGRNRSSGIEAAELGDVAVLVFAKLAVVVSFTVIRKYLQQLIINADKQSASKSREHITFISGRFSASLLRNRKPFLRADI